MPQATAASDIERGMLVKEYVEGLTLDEMQQLVRKRHGEEKANELYYQALDEAKKVRDVFKGFEAWLKRQTPPPSKNFWDHTRRHRSSGDFKDDNLLFDLRRQKWVVIDP